MNLVTTLAWLVDTKSETGDEGRLCTLLQERLLPRWGMDGVHRIGNSLVVGRRTGRPLLALYGHLDTVPAQGDHRARIDGDRMFGLGTSDMKAGVAVMVHLLEDDAIRQGPYDVVGVFYDREEGPAHENGLIEVLDRAEWLDDAAFAVVLEPTDLEVQVGCQGALNATVTFLGKSAHSARPWLGSNAVTRAGAWLASMHERERRQVEVDGLEFFEVMTVTTAAGGLARNVVPGRFDVNVNHRFPPSMTLREAEERLRLACEGADVIEIVDAAPAAPVPTGNPHHDRLVAASGRPRTPKQAWTDVARLAARGVPAVNYGPGEVAQAHQTDESVPLANLDEAHRVLRDFLAN